MRAKFEFRCTECTDCTKRFFLQNRFSLLFGVVRSGKQQREGGDPQQSATPLDRSKEDKGKKEYKERRKEKKKKNSCVVRVFLLLMNEVERLTRSGIPTTVSEAIEYTNRVNDALDEIQRLKASGSNPKAIIKAYLECLGDDGRAAVAAAVRIKAGGNNMDYDDASSSLGHYYRQNLSSPPPGQLPYAFSMSSSPMKRMEEEVDPTAPPSVKIYRRVAERRKSIAMGLVPPGMGGNSFNIGPGAPVDGSFSSSTSPQSAFPINRNNSAMDHSIYMINGVGSGGGGGQYRSSNNINSNYPPVRNHYHRNEEGSGAISPRLMVRQHSVESLMGAGGVSGELLPSGNSSPRSEASSTMIGEGRGRRGVGQQLFGTQQQQYLDESWGSMVSDERRRGGGIHPGWEPATPNSAFDRTPRMTGDDQQSFHSNLSSPMMYPAGIAFPTPMEHGFSPTSPTRDSLPPRQDKVAARTARRRSSIATISAIAAETLKNMGGGNNRGLETVGEGEGKQQRERDDYSSVDRNSISGSSAGRDESATSSQVGVNPTITTTREIPTLAPPVPVDNKAEVIRNIQEVEIPPRIVEPKAATGVSKNSEEEDDKRKNQRETTPAATTTTTTATAADPKEKVIAEEPRVAVVDVAPVVAPVVVAAPIVEKTENVEKAKREEDDAINRGGAALIPPTILEDEGEEDEKPTSPQQKLVPPTPTKEKEPERERKPDNSSSNNNNADAESVSSQSSATSGAAAATTTSTASRLSALARARANRQQQQATGEESPTATPPPAPAPAPAETATPDSPTTPSPKVLSLRERLALRKKQEETPSPS